MKHKKNVILGSILFGVLAVVSNTWAEIAEQSASKSTPKIRIALPEDQDPMIYIFAHAASVGYAKGYAESIRSLYTTETTLSAREREAMRATVMLTEENLTMKTSPKLEFSNEIIPLTFYENLNNYKTWPGYSERERLIMDFIRHFVSDHRSLNGNEALWEKLDNNFSDREIMDLVLSSGSYAMIHSINKVIGLTPAFLQEAAKRNSVVGEKNGPRTVGLVTKKLLDTIKERESASNQ